MRINNKKTIKISLLLVAVLNLGFISGQEQWIKLPAIIYDSAINTIAVDPNVPDRLWVGSKKGLYQSSGSIASDRSVLFVQKLNKDVRDIYIEEGRVPKIFAATTDGLYVGENNGQTWKKIFQGTDVLSRQCLSVVKAGEALYVGTRQGLFVSGHEWSSWHRMEGPFSNEGIYHLQASSRNLYLASISALYQMDTTTNDIQEILKVSLSQGEIEEVIAQFEEEEAVLPHIRAIEIISQNPDRLMVLTTKGVFESQDNPRLWDSLSFVGLSLKEATSLLTREVNGGLEIYAGTRQGVYRYEQERWVPLYDGIGKDFVIDMAKSRNNRVYAAALNDIFILNDEQALSGPEISAEPVSPSPADSYADLQEYFAYEPTVRHVQEMAIDYAEVHPNKIRRWRELASRKALLPSISVGLDRDIGELDHWDTGASPDQLIEGKERTAWDLTLSWDLADLVWTSDQTSIDSRSKLMVELRESVLDQVTRLYFERRRLQIELITNSVSLSTPNKVELKMRIAEITALLDALTGGTFSQRLSNIAREEKSPTQTQGGTQ